MRRLIAFTYAADFVNFVESLMTFKRQSFSVPKINNSSFTDLPSVSICLNLKHAD